jgi:hypothetical protein
MWRPAVPHGYSSVAVYCLSILALTVAAVAGVCAVSHVKIIQGARGSIPGGRRAGGVARALSVTA